MVLVLTEQAVHVIGEIVRQSELGAEGGLRISGSPDGNGDSGLEFALAVSPLAGDEVVRDGKAVVFLDGAAATALADKTLDVEAHDDHFHFSLADQDGDGETG